MLKCTPCRKFHLGLVSHLNISKVLREVLLRPEVVFCSRNQPSMTFLPSFLYVDELWPLAYEACRILNVVLGSFVTSCMGVQRAGRSTAPERVDNCFMFFPFAGNGSQCEYETLRNSFVTRTDGCQWLGLDQARMFCFLRHYVCKEFPHSANRQLSGLALACEIESQRIWLMAFN